MSMMNNVIAARSQKGFTLIELVMVIVILGILAAFALPRFANLGGEARAATLKGAQGSVKSAAAIAHSKWLAQPTPGSVDLEGAPGVTMSTDGYPTADGAGIGTAAQLDAADFTVTPTASGDENVDPATIEVVGASGTCEFTYDPKSGQTPTSGYDASSC